MLFLRLLGESLRMSVHALVVNKLRTTLSLLGITIGIMAIISVFTVVDAMEKYIRDSIQSLGDNVIYVQKWPWTYGKDYPWWKYFQRPVPDLKEMEQVKQRSQTAAAVALMASTSATVIHGNNSLEGVSIVAVSHDYEDIKAFELQAGRYFTQFESSGGRNVAVIGADVAAGLFPRGNYVGKEIKFKGRKVTVIGVFSKEGESMFGNSADTQVLIPANFARNIFNISKEQFNPFIMVKAKEHVTNQELIDELRGIMRSIRRLKPKADDNFALNEISLLSQSMEGLFQVIGLAGWVIGMFSILVGGFGIANIMFVSVKERTPIIGIQKSLGAKNFFILFQFLFEAVFLCMIGGTFGLLIVFLFSVLATEIFDMNLILTFKNVLVGLGISAVIGLIAGIIPAFVASRLDPVEAIRANG